jgi:hypothetical protein
MRDLSRARLAAHKDLRRKRQQITSMMLRLGRHYPGKKTWGPAHMDWLMRQKLEHREQRIDNLGWDKATDTRLSAYRSSPGNFDHVTNTVKWDLTITDHTLPNSLYLTKRPAFSGAGPGYTWPSVDPTGATKLYTSPAKVRYDAGTPSIQH